MATNASRFLAGILLNWGNVTPFGIRQQQAIPRIPRLRLPAADTQVLQGGAGGRDVKALRRPEDRSEVAAFSL